MGESLLLHFVAPVARAIRGFISGGWLVYAGHLTDMLKSDYLLGSLAVCFQVAMLCLLVRRKIHRRFPLFVVFSVYWMIANLAQIWAMSQPFFFTFYRVTEVGGGILSILAIHEVVRSVFSKKEDECRRWVLAQVSVVVAVFVDLLWQGVRHPMGLTNEARFAAVSYSFQRDILLLEIGVFGYALIVDWRRREPIRWGRYRFGIIAGFGAPAIITLAAQLLRTYFGAQYEEAFRYMTPGAYFGKMLIWLWCFSRDDAHARQTVSETNKEGGMKHERDPGSRYSTEGLILPKPL